jgi:hypothetical protein
MEAELLETTSALVEAGLTPNFCLLVGAPPVRTLETAEGDLLDGFVRCAEASASRSGAPWVCALFSMVAQTLLGGAVALQQLDVRHGALLPENVAWDAIEPVWFCYEALGRTWTVPTFGFLAMVIDFGAARRPAGPLCRDAGDLLHAVCGGGGPLRALDALWPGERLIETPEARWMLAAADALESDPRLREALMETRMHDLLDMHRPSRADRVLHFDVDGVGEWASRVGARCGGTRLDRPRLP